MLIVLLSRGSQPTRYRTRLNSQPRKDYNSQGNSSEACPRQNKCRVFVACVSHCLNDSRQAPIKKSMTQNPQVRAINEIGSAAKPRSRTLGG